MSIAGLPDWLPKIGHSLILVYIVAAFVSLTLRLFGERLPRIRWHLKRYRDELLPWALGGYLIVFIDVTMRHTWTDLFVETVSLYILIRYWRDEENDPWRRRGARLWAAVRRGHADRSL